MEFIEIPSSYSLESGFALSTEKDVNPLESRSREQPCIVVSIELIGRLLPDITSTALKIFLALGSRLELDNMIVAMSCTELEKATGLSKQTVREGLNELETLKFITRLGPNVRRKYVLNEMHIRRKKKCTSDAKNKV